jgi:hypothetical protein
VGFPINQAGALFWVGQVSRFIVSADYACDEEFTSPLAYNKRLYHDAIPVRSKGTPIDTSIPIAYTGPPFVTMDPDDPSIPWTPYTILPPEFPAETPLSSDFFISDVLGEEGERNIGDFPSDRPITIDDNTESIIEEQIPNDDYEFNDAESVEYAQPLEDELIEEGYIELPQLRRSSRLRNIERPQALPMTAYVNSVITSQSHRMPSELCRYAMKAVAESLVQIPIPDPNPGEAGSDPCPFLPEPKGLK